MMLRRESALSMLALLALTAVLAHSMGFFDAARIVKGLANLAIFAGDLFPPDFSVASTIATALVETIQMALLGTILGFAAALPLGLLGARNIAGEKISPAARLFMGAIRTIPALLWAIIFVVAFGLGPLPGTLGLAVYSTGYLSKLFYEAFEAVDKEVVEAARAIGISRLKEIRFVLLPESMSHILSQLFFMFEYNVRSSTILGFVGAGGIGFYMLGYIQVFQYQKLTTAILLTLAVVLIIDHLSAKMRDRFLAHGELRSP